MLYEAWEHFKDLLCLCPYHGLQCWMMIQDFYNSVTQAVSSTIDAVARGTLMSKNKDETYNLIEEMALNNFQWSIKQPNPGRLEVSLKLILLLYFLIK